LYQLVHICCWSCLYLSCSISCDGRCKSDCEVKRGGPFGSLFSAACLESC